MLLCIYFLPFFGYQLDFFQIGFIDFPSSKFTRFCFLNAFMHSDWLITLLLEYLQFPIDLVILVLLRFTKKLLDLFFQKMEIQLFTSYNLYKSKNADVYFKICELVFERIKKSLERSGFCGCSKLTTKCSGYRIEKIHELYS